jgi:acyl-CoA dehydrogenase
MDFDLSEEDRLLQQTVRRFVQEEMIPLETQFPGVPTVSDEVAEPINKRLRQKAESLGLRNLTVPKEYGGAELHGIGQMVVQEEQGHYLGPTGFNSGIGGGAPAFLYGASEEMKQKYLWPILRGEMSSGFAQTEPHTGSDPASLETKAELRGDKYVMNGRKVFISSGGRGKPSDVYHVIATVDRTKNRAGIAGFLVESKWPGFEYVRRIQILQGVGLQACELAFHDVEIPQENLVSEEGEGFAVAQAQLGIGRMSFGPRMVGQGDRLLGMATTYAKQRITFGQPIAQRQAIQWMLADSAIDIECCRWLSYRGGWMRDQKMDVRQIAAMIKVFAAEAGGRVTDRVVQVYGASGASDDLPIGRAWIAARHWRIGEGTVEMMRFIIARNLLRD